MLSQWIFGGIQTLLLSGILYYLREERKEYLRVTNPKAIEENVKNQFKTMQQMARESPPPPPIVPGDEWKEG